MSKGQKLYALRFLRYALCAMRYAFCPLRYALCAMLFVLCAMLFALFLNSPVFAGGLGGGLSLNYSSTEQFEDDEKTSAQDTFNRIFYLHLGKSITPALSYQLNLRTSLSDSDSTNSEGMTTTSYQRRVAPAIDFSLRNPMYALSTGYRRQEGWETAHLTDAGRRSAEFYYSRFNLTPYALPSLSIQFDRQRDFDYLSTKKIDSSSTRYTGSSGYQFSYRDLNLMYNLTYSHNVRATPVSIINKSISDNLSGLYSLGYSRSFLGGTTSISAGYQGNYARNKNRQFVSQTGSVLFERTTLGGLYALGTASKPDVEALTSEVSLIDNDFNTGITNINLGANKFHNIGIWVSSGKSVDMLYIYVDKDVSTDTNLTNPGNWKVYRSDFNQPGTWTETAIQSAGVTAYDTMNNIYRYEIEFSAPQNASYFKAVNMETVNAPAITDVSVTEIEAWGTDVVPQTNTLTDVSTFFTQGLNLSVHLKPVTKLKFSFNYSINRADQNPVSLRDSLDGIFVNIFSQSTTGEEEDLTSNITRTYGAASTWIAHRLLTTALRFQRSEAFDNKNETDVSSNTYSLSFNSAPLHTLETNLSLIRSDRYSFDEKESANNSFLLSISSKLYRNLNMITDMGYTQSKSYTNDTQSSTPYIKGSIDALFTRKLFGNLAYGLSRTSSGDISSSSKEGSTKITYRPARFINLSGSFSIIDTDGNTTASEEFLIGWAWLPLPAIRLNLNYQYSRSEPGTSTSNSFSGHGRWRITKFMNARLTYGYTRKVEEKKTESYNFGANLNCRF